MADLAFRRSNGRMDKRLVKIVAAKIRAVRESKGYSQEGFAALADMDRSRYGRIERGQVNISISTLFQIAVSLGVDAPALIEEMTFDVMVGVVDPDDGSVTG